MACAPGQQLFAAWTSRCATNVHHPVVRADVRPPPAATYCHASRWGDSDILLSILEDSMRLVWSGLVWSGLVVAPLAHGATPTLDADVEGRAYGGRLDDSYNHPLLSSTVTELVSTSARTTDELLHDLHSFDRIVVASDGSRTTTSGAELITGEAGDALTPESERGELMAGSLPLVDPDIQSMIDDVTAAPADPVEVDLVLDPLSWNPIVSVEHELMVAMLEGRVSTRRDALTVRNDAMDARQAAGERAIAGLLASIETTSADVVDSFPLTGTVRVRADAADLADLVNIDGVAHVDLVRDETTAAGYPTGTEVTGGAITGEEVENLLQTTQFYDAGYDGSADGYIGLEEGDAGSGGHQVRRNHPGFDDGAGVDRWENCAVPIGAFCTYNGDPDPGNPHATGVASILLGDLTRGQDSTIPTSGQRARSGVARGATGLGAGTGSTQTVQVMTAAWRDIHLLNHSAGTSGAVCTGTSSAAQDYNTLYESGVAAFQAAGNEGHTGADCTVRDPGAAIGVFTIGAFQVDGSDNEIIYPNLSRGGGVFYDGSAYVDDGRTLIDVLGATVHEHSYDEDSTASDQYPGDLCCTSGATPTATGAAALFRDWYLSSVGTAIDSPGLLYANLLLMGDRIDESGTYLDTGFDELTGAGKLRMRMWDNLDGPAAWGDGSLCVDDGTSYDIDIAPAGLDADVDTVRAVIWWYDHRHDSGTPHDKVNLALQRQQPRTGNWVTTRLSATDDNKQRVYTDTPSTQPYRIRITGRDVTSDSEGCGIDSTRVCYAWVYEDQDRDTGTSLDNQIRPE
ncbi:MAG: hypothetical protein D6798_19195 [Deltaproteobacteria bacterium]|nr:MAG: hypothetical protein D6798_19195 [Deltaproteobacteria bacterium]